MAIMAATCEFAQFAVNVELTVLAATNEPPKQRDAEVLMFVATFVPDHAEIVPLLAFEPTPIKMMLPATDVVTDRPPVAAFRLSVVTTEPSSVTDAAAPATSQAQQPWPVLPPVHDTLVSPPAAILYATHTESPDEL